MKIETYLFTFLIYLTEIYQRKHFLIIRWRDQLRRIITRSERAKSRRNRREVRRRERAGNSANRNVESETRTRQGCTRPASDPQRSSLDFRCCRFEPTSTSIPEKVKHLNFMSIFQLTFWIFINQILFGSKYKHAILLDIKYESTYQNLINQFFLFLLRICQIQESAHSLS